VLIKLAIEYDIAIDVPHHTKKGLLVAGDADAGRGGSSMRDAARLVSTLTTMTPDEAALFGVDEVDRHDYIRLDPAKVNVARRSQKATWFQLINVNLKNPNLDYPDGDDVQTLEPWNPPDTWAGLQNTSLNAALTEINKGLGNGQRYSDANSAGDRAAWAVVHKHCPGKTEQQCREIVRTWIKTGVLYKEPYDDPVARKNRIGLYVNAAKRPGTET
jgi:hypothetical protein